MSKKIKKQLSDYAKYSSIAIQMAVIIAGGVFGGLGLDKLIKSGFPVFTIVFSLAGVVFAIYMIIRDYTRNKPK